MNKIDTALTLFDSRRLELVQKYHIDFGIECNKNYNKTNAFSEGMYYPGVALFLILKDIKYPQKLILSVNTHLLFNMRHGHVKFAMIVLIFKAINELKQRFDIATVFLCGDFNLIPNSMLYAYICDKKLDLNSDLKFFSGQSYAINLSKNASLHESTLMQDRKFQPSKFEQMQKNEDVFYSILMDVRLKFCYEESEICFESGSFSTKTSEQLSAYFIELSKTVNLKSSYSEFNKISTLKKSQLIENQNYENAISFFATTMASNVDYIFASSSELELNSVLEKPKVADLEKSSLTAPFGNFPSDHFCLFTGFRKIDKWE